MPAQALSHAEGLAPTACPYDQDLGRTDPVTDVATNTTAPWINRYGTLTNVLVLKTKKGAPYIQATLVSINKGSTFTTPITTFSPKVIDAIKAAGNGAYISLRGPMESVDRADGKFSELRFKAMMVNTKKASTTPGADAPVASKSRIPAVQKTTTTRKIDDNIPF